MDAGFNASLIARAEAIAPKQFDAVRLPLVHAWLQHLPEPAAVWARLFAYRDAVDEPLARSVLGEALIQALKSANALQSTNGQLRASLRLMPFAGLLLGSDEVDARFDPVMGPGATTFELWRAVEISDSPRVLDIGCGAGSLALAAARAGAREVVGVDLDPRAVAYARFNAKLNGISNARFEAGDLSAPVAGQRFELIVSQPPFVTQPASVAATTYLHGGRRGDELALRMLSELPPLLGERGRAIALFDSADDEALIDRLTAAVNDPTLRIIAVAAKGLGADQQALGYASTSHSKLGPDYAAAAIAYREHLRELGIERTRHVLVLVERPDSDGAPRFSARVDTDGARLHDAAALTQLRRALDAAALPDAALLQLSVRPSPHALFVHERSLAGTCDDRLRIRFEGGHASDRELSEAAAALIEILAQTHTLTEAVEHYAQMCRATPEQVAASVARFVRESLVNGLLVLERQ
ncbi:putative methyltransferase SCO0760 [Enhygromyxa salina]|uniref:Putative methyltransferase SCO0760 n=2 Tax=Enhygromyxa salina TaxID=215803 RepID=A0A0C1ZA75_9BACT|nr:putative methyltransferase SCO0760 [Enhygromyxa salina]